MFYPGDIRTIQLIHLANIIAEGEDYCFRKANVVEVEE
jgi:hypothetical protein